MVFQATTIATALLLLSLVSCTENRVNAPPASQKEYAIKPPAAIAAGQPIIKKLEDGIRPQRFSIPETGSVNYSVNTRQGMQQRVISAPETRPASYFVAMQKISTDQGLLVPAARACLVDSRGILWIGTQGGGVTGYDGKSTITFTSQHGVANNTVRSIVEDHQGNVWFGCEGGGISKYDGTSITSYTTKQGLANNEVREITVGKDGTLWIATRYGISHFTEGHFQNFTMADGLVSNDFHSSLADSKGNYWFGSRDGVSCYNGKTFTNFTTADGLIGNEIFAIEEDKAGNIWFGCGEGGASMYDGKSFTNVAEVTPSIHSIRRDKTGRLWIGTYRGGVYCYDGNAFTQLTVNNGLADNIVSDFAEDRSGNIWIATHNGANCYPGNAIVSYTRNEGLTDNVIRSVFEDGNGDYWFGTNSGFACRLREGQITPFTFLQGLNHNRVHRIMKDNVGNLWFCTGDGVSCYNGKSIISYSVDQGLPYTSVRCIVQDKQGNTWFGTEMGLSKFDGRSFYNYTSQQGMAYNNVRDMVLDDEGNLWLGFSTNGGVSRFDGKTFINLDTAQGMTDIDITSMTLDSRGNIWIGSGNHGVNVLRKSVLQKFKDPKSIKPTDRLFENITTEEGLSDDVVWDIAEDRQGNIIVGTNVGFTVIRGGLHPQQPISRDNLEWYNRKTGYPVKDVNTQAMYVDSKGYIWAGTGEKLVRFNYSAVRKDPAPPRLRVQGVRINNEKLGWYNLLSARKANTHEASGTAGLLSAITAEESVTYGRGLNTIERDSVQKKFTGIEFDSVMPYYPVPTELKLPYRFNNVTIDFGAMELSRPELVRYQYMLEGYDKGWSPVTSQSSASFGNINEGNYTFKVKAMSPDGVWSEPVSFLFEVQPPWWRTWWFRLAYAALLIGLLVFFVKWRIGVVRRNEQKKIANQKELLEMEARALRAQMNPHFIFNCLNSIKALMQQRETERGIAYLTTFSKLIRTLFNNSDKRQITLYDEVETCKLYAQLEAMRLNGNLQYNFTIDPGLDLKSVMVPALIIQPFIENAIWHGIVPNDKGTINVLIKGGREAIVCEVDDDGIGRETSKLNKPVTHVIHESKGVHLSQRRLDLEKILNDTNASIKIVDKYENNIATGTKVILSFNLN